MNRPNADKDTLAALRELPAEVSIDQVKHMVAAFPLAMGAMAWLLHTLKFNLNSVLMTSTASLIIGTSAYLIGTSAPTELPAATPLPAVVLEMPVTEALPEPEPAVVFERPAAATKSAPAPKQQQPEMACMVLSEDSLVVAPSTPEGGEPIAAATNFPALTPTRPLAPATTTTNGERIFPLRDFTGIKVVSSMDVTLEIGEFAVTAIGEEDALEQLDVQVKDRVLVLDFLITGRSRRTCGPVHFTVRSPLVNALTVMGSGSINGTELPGTPKMDLSVTGSGSITLTRLLDAPVLNMLVRGSGGIQLEEVVQTERAELSVTGSGVANVGRISKARDLQVLVAGSGTADCNEVTVSGTTTLNLTGSGEVTVTGRTERIDISVFGSGDVMAKDLKAQGGRVTVTGSGDASVHSSGPLEMLTTGSGKIHRSGSAGANRSRGVGSDD